MVPKSRIFLSFLALPFLVVVIVPGSILYLESGSLFPELPKLLISLVVFISGAALFIWTNRLFIVRGRGTLAPWDPPREFITEGPYCYVRNPMILGVWLMLLGEALFFRSPGIGIWAMIFSFSNLAYLPLVEERDLKKRFGRDFEEYRQNVPAWIPRLTPWRRNHES